MMRRLIVLGAVALLSACASGPRWQGTPENRARFEARATHLQRLNDWQIAGRFSFTRHQDRIAATLSWQQTPAHFQLALSDPLGQDIARLEGEGQQHRITLAGRGSLTGTDPDALLDEAIGYPLPITKLKYWVRGLPAEGASDRRWLDERGRLQQLEDEGWTVSYQRYTTVGALELPALMTLENRWFTLKFAILDWQLANATASESPR